MCQSVPQANRLMAEFFGDDDDLGLAYRNHAVPGVRGSTRKASIRGVVRSGRVRRCSAAIGWCCT